LPLFYVINPFFLSPGINSDAVGQWGAACSAQYAAALEAFCHWIKRLPRKCAQLVRLTINFRGGDGSTFGNAKGLQRWWHEPRKIEAKILPSVIPLSRVSLAFTISFSSLVNKGDAILIGDNIKYTCHLDALRNCNWLRFDIPLRQCTQAGAKAEIIMEAHIRKIEHYVRKHACCVGSVASTLRQGYAMAGKVVLDALNDPKPTKSTPKPRYVHMDDSAARGMRWI
jgi:hypothetical protein